MYHPNRYPPPSAEGQQSASPESWRRAAIGALALMKLVADGDIKLEQAIAAHAAVVDRCMNQDATTQ